jgi:N-acetylmuramoyl-L-alanine amidase
LVKIKKDLIPGYDAYPMNPKYITVHNTANTSQGATDEMHARYLKGIDWSNKSWHFTVDDDSATQHIPTNLNGWHAGDGENGTGNRESIGIEICENVDGDYQKAEQNAIELIRYLMEEHTISITNIVPHKHWSGKNCPRRILSRWDSFIEQIKNHRGSSKPEFPSKPVTPRKQGEILYLPPTTSTGERNDRWALYYLDKPPIRAKANVKLELNPYKFGGLTYEILGDHPTFPHVVKIKSEQAGEGWIYVHPNTSAVIRKGTIPKSSNKKYLNLHKHMNEWGIYKVNAVPVKKNQFAQLRPAKFGGLSYEILGNPQANIYTIQTEDFGMANIYAPRDEDSSITNTPLYN